MKKRKLKLKYEFLPIKSEERIKLAFEVIFREVEEEMRQKYENQHGIQA